MNKKANTIKMVIEKNPEKYDSDDVRFIKDGKQVGFGYKGKIDGKIGLMRCPKCELENYAMAVADGTCAWCGYNVLDK